jgi:hypothetical protein
VVPAGELGLPLPVGTVAGAPRSVGSGSGVAGSGTSRAGAGRPCAIGAGLASTTPTITLPNATATRSATRKATKRRRLARFAARLVRPGTAFGSGVGRPLRSGR